MDSPQPSILTPFIQAIVFALIVAFIFGIIRYFRNKKKPPLQDVTIPGEEKVLKKSSPVNNIFAGIIILVVAVLLLTLFFFFFIINGAGVV